MSWTFRMPIIVMLLFIGFLLSMQIPIIKQSNTIRSGDLIASYEFNGDVTDNTGFHNGSVQGAEITTNRFSSTKSAFRFNGEGDHLDLGPEFISMYDSVSISLWIYPYTICEPNDTLTIDPMADQYFLSSSGINQSTGIFGIWNKGALMMGQVLENCHSEYNYHTFLNDGTWHHIVVFFDAIQKELMVYINGALSFTLAYEAGISALGIDNLFIGGANFISGNGFKGKVDDVKFYSRKISQMEILDLYNEDCPDSLILDDLHIKADTFIYAKSYLSIDSLKLDPACNLNLITPIAHFTEGVTMNPTSSIVIKNTSGCNQSGSVHDPHMSHRGIYINNFVTDGILDNTIKEDSLIQWCKDQNFNTLYLYNIGTALSSGLSEELDSFVHKSNDQFLEITFVSAGFGTSFDNITTYHDDYTHIPQGIVSEIEFWNGSGDYDLDYAPWLEKLNDLKFMVPVGETSPRNPDLKRRFYIGKIKNPGELPNISIAEDLVANHDEIFLTSYHSSAYNLSTSSSENSIRNKLSLLAEAAKNLGKEVNIVVLFNVRQDSPAPNIWNYFSEDFEDHDFQSAYENFYHDFLEATDISYKQYINLKGYGIYRYSDAQEAR